MYTISHVVQMGSARGHGDTLMILVTIVEFGYTSMMPRIRTHRFSCAAPLVSLVFVLTSPNTTVLDLTWQCRVVYMAVVYMAVVYMVVPSGLHGSGLHGSAEWFTWQWFTWQCRVVYWSMLISCICLAVRRSPDPS